MSHCILFPFLSLFPLFSGQTWPRKKREENKKRQCPEETSSLWASPPPPPWNSPRVLFPQPHLPASSFSSFSLFSCRRVCLGPSVGKGNRPMFFEKDEQLFGEKRNLVESFTVRRPFSWRPSFLFLFFVLLGAKGRRKSIGGRRPPHFSDSIISTCEEDERKDCATI